MMNCKLNSVVPYVFTGIGVKLSLDQVWEHVDFHVAPGLQEIHGPKWLQYWENGKYRDTAWLNAVLAMDPATTPVLVIANSSLKKLAWWYKKLIQAGFSIGYVNLEWERYAYHQGDGLPWNEDQAHQQFYLRFGDILNLEEFSWQRSYPEKAYEVNEGHLDFNPDWPGVIPEEPRPLDVLPSWMKSTRLGGYTWYKFVQAQGKSYRQDRQAFWANDPEQDRALAPEEFQQYLDLAKYFGPKHLYLWQVEWYEEAALAELGRLETIYGSVTQQSEIHWDFWITK